MEARASNNQQTAPRENQPISFSDWEERHGERKKTVENKWSDLMDRMQEAVGVRGKFFVSIGGKDTLASFTYHGGAVRKDTRALIPIEPVQQEDPNEQLFVVITADGVKGIRYNKRLGDEIPRDMESLLRKKRYEGAHEEEMRASYRRWRRHNLTLPDIVRRMTSGERMFRGQDGLLNRTDGFSWKDNVVTFGIYDSDKDERIRVGEDMEAIAPIEYSLIPIEDMGLVEKAFKASYASAKAHENSPHSPQAESPEEKSKREGYFRNAETKALEESSKRADEVSVMVQEGLPPKPIRKMLRP